MPNLISIFDKPSYSGITTGNVNEVPFFDVESLSNYVGLPTSLVINTVENSDSQYNTFFIDKDTNKIVPYSEKLRLRRIDAPSPLLKEIQNAILDLIELLPYADCNYGFVHGKSIIDAAKAVAKGDALIHCDIKDFFNNHTSTDVNKKLTKILNAQFPNVFTEDFILFMVKALCLNNRLPQGSPASPMLTVVLNKSLDERVAKLAATYGVTYARYVDDMVFSGTITNANAYKLMDDLSELVHPLRLNRKKCGVMRNAAKPVCKGYTIATNGFMQSTMQASIVTLCRKLTPNITRIKSSPHLITVDFDHTGSLDEFLTILEAVTKQVTTKYKKYEFTIKRSFFYIQSVKTVLGLHVDKGNVNFPRKQYNEMRLEAMLLGIQRALFFVKHIATDLSDNDLRILVEILAQHNGTTIVRTCRNMLHRPLNRKTFNGKRAYIKSVDPKKAEALSAIETKAFKQMLNKIKSMYNGSNALNLANLLRRHL